MRLWIVLFLCATGLYAEPFREAKVSKAEGSVIKGKTLFQTGPNSKAELDFHDGSLARLGANARFSFSPGSRETRLDSGTLLISSPKDAGGVTVRSAGVTTTATGPVDFEVANINGNVKVICLSGKPTVYLTANSRVKDGLRPGQMLSIPSGATKLSRADVVDLKVLLSTSTLMQMGELPSAKTLNRNAAKQGATLPVNLPGGANNLIQSASQTRILISMQQSAAAQQQAIQDQLAAQQLAKQQLAQQQAAQAAMAQQLAVMEQEKAKQLAVEQQIANANVNTNQGQGPQGNNGNPNPGNPNNGNNGKPPNVPPGQNKPQPK